MSNILSLFAKSPFEPLYEHHLRVQECVNLVKPLFNSLFEGNNEEFKRISTQIYKAENEADQIKNQIRNTVPKGVFLPVNREDLFRFLKIQDDMADCVEDITVLLTMKELVFTPEFVQEVMSFIDVVLTACHLADLANKNLRTLVNAAFKGQEIQEVLNLVDQVEKAEREGDKAGHALAHNLFTHEDVMKASDLILWFRILDLIGDLADYSAKTGEWLRTMLIR